MNEADQTATKLWEQLGGQQGTGMPLAQWVNNEVVKAKTSGTYKQGMSFQQLYDLNRKEVVAETKTPETVNKKFTIMGYNGYYVIGGAAAVIGLIYLASKHFKKQTNG